MLKAVALPGCELHEPGYSDSEDIFDRLAGQYQRGLAFVKRNLHYVQGDQGINSLGILEIPEIVLQELLVNALIHRDYFISAPIRALVFADRVEISNPGHLPNHLNVEQIHYGLSNMRNPLLASHATHLLPYRGLVCRQSSIDESCGILFLEDRAEGCPSRPGVLRWKNTVLR